MLKKILSYITLIIIIAGCSSWGFMAHRTINQLAIYSLPKSMQPFFYGYKDSLVRNAPRPDQRRNVDSTEGNRHFMDFEYFGSHPFDVVPHNWKDAAAKFTADTLRKYGTLPYTIIETEEKLTQAFKNKDRDAILFYAADLGHYIGDAHVPLHTSMNYDGQLTNQRGIHDLWETSAPEAAIDNYYIASRHKAKYLSSVSDAVWNILQHTYSLVPQMLAIEKEVSKQFTDSTKYIWQFRWGKNRRFYSPAFAKAYNDALKGSINDQLIASAQVVSDFWYTAWVNGGRPSLGDLAPGNYKKCAFRKEKRMYHRNKLLKEHLLMSRQVRTTD